MKTRLEALDAPQTPCRRWRLLLVAVCALALLPWTTPLFNYCLTPACVRLVFSAALGTQRADPPRLSNGRTELVQWDKYSLFVRGQRIFLQSGEFHTFRLPVPGLWIDILEKAKAAGLNAISVYIDWGLVHPSHSVLDFDGYRALQPLFDAAMQTGLWIVFRPGPYINAEVSAGGIPGWVTSEVPGSLRSNGTDFARAWQPYMERIIELSKGAQITRGGPIIAWQIENEYTADPEIGVPNKAEYMADLETFVRERGIDVPLTFNDASNEGQFAHGLGAVDLYGVDSYPQSFDCSNPHVWFDVVESYYEKHLSVNPDQPFYIPEFQGGAFDPWGPNAPGYDACRNLTGPAFESVFYKHLWAHNARMINYYMFYGGTSWGSLPFPGVYTSYDYGAPVTESREIGPKYAELKLQSMFLRSARDFYKTDIVGNSTSPRDSVRVSNDQVFATALINPDTRAGFFILRQTNSSSLDVVNTTLTVPTSQGKLTLPRSVTPLELAGRESKVVVTDFTFGAGSRLLYSTAAVLFSGTLGGRDALVLHGSSAQSHELAVALGSRSGSIAFPRGVRLAPPVGRYTSVAILPGVDGIITLWDSEAQLILYADSASAAGLWFPPLHGRGSLGAFWGIGTNTSVLVGGPHLVRNAELTSGGTLALRGDLKEDAQLLVVGPPGVRSITWNGETVSLNAAPAIAGAFVGELALRVDLTALEPPALTGWRFAEGLPEIGRDFNDSRWVSAKRSGTHLPMKPVFGGPPVLYACDYGFCEGSVLWRARFNGTNETVSANFSINGGEAFAASVWINDVFVKTTYGNSSNNRNIIEETVELFEFPDASVRDGEENVITILQDNQGLNETDNWYADSSKSPRGIRGALLTGGNFTSWKVQGKLGGYTNFVDQVRGVVNEGGTYGERAGWHLPGFDVSASTWGDRSLEDGLPDGRAGVGVFVTKFDLDLPKGVDVPISFVFDDGVGDTGVPYRAYLYVNGWMMGKRVANLGPQAIFPVQEGILGYHGQNTVAVVLWAMEAVDAIKPTLRLSFDGRYEGGVGGIVVNNPGWQARDL